MKHAREDVAVDDPIPFSPLLVGVLSETAKLLEEVNGGPVPFSPLLVGVLSETTDCSKCQIVSMFFQSPTGRGAQ